MAKHTIIITEKLINKRELTLAEVSQLKLEIDQKIREKHKLIKELESDRNLLISFYKSLSKNKDYPIAIFVQELINLGVLERGGGIYV